MPISTARSAGCANPIAICWACWRARPRSRSTTRSGRRGWSRRSHSAPRSCTATNADLAQRNAELAIINSIQQGLAAELDFQAIVDLVGDKLREVFNTPDLGINWYDEKANLLHYLYAYEHGKRLVIEPRPPNPGGNFETITQYAPASHLQYRRRL